MRALFFLLASLLITVAPGCSGTGTPAVEPPILKPVIEPAPVSVAVYYSENLRDHRCTGDWTFAMGPPSIEMFDVIFAALFGDVETRDTGPKITSPGDQRDIIELHLSEFTGCQASWPILGTTVIDIAYEAIVRSAEGEELARWNGRGRAGPGDDLEGYSGSAWEPELAHLNALTGVAMRKAAADFVVNFENDPAVRTWVGE